MYGPDEIRDDQAIAVITVLDIGTLTPDLAEPS
jgi:hypothetical protein